MAEFTAKDVQALRQATGAGMMDAKKALVDAEGDFDAAAKKLREKGLAKAATRTDRENVTAALGLMKELRQKVSDHMKTSQAITDGLRRILTPVQVTGRAILAQFWRNFGAIILTPTSLVLQVAKFLMWVEKNKASMDLLNSLNHADLA